MAVLAKILFAETLRVSERRNEVPEGLEALIGRMMAREPSQRPRDGAAVAAALRTLDQEEGPQPSRAAGGALAVGERRLLAVVLVERPLVGEVRGSSTLGDTL